MKPKPRLQKTLTHNTEQPEIFETIGFPLTGVEIPCKGAGRSGQYLGLLFTDRVHAQKELQD